MARCFVVSLMRGGVRLYLTREEMGEIDLKTGEIIKESRGVFTPDLVVARKFLNKTQALITCSAYEGAEVEVIKTGEVLK